MRRLAMCIYCDITKYFMLWLIKINPLNALVCDK